MTFRLNYETGVDYVRLDSVTDDELRLTVYPAPLHGESSWVLRRVKAP
jgi:hypothetical protein